MCVSEKTRKAKDERMEEHFGSMTESETAVDDDEIDSLIQTVFSDTQPPQHFTTEDFIDSNTQTARIEGKMYSLKDTVNVISQSFPTFTQPQNHFDFSLMDILTQNILTPYLAQLPQTTMAFEASKSLFPNSYLDQFVAARYSLSCYFKAMQLFSKSLLECGQCSNEKFRVIFCVINGGKIQDFLAKTQCLFKTVIKTPTLVLHGMYPGDVIVFADVMENKEMKVYAWGSVEQSPSVNNPAAFELNFSVRDFSAINEFSLRCEEYSVLCESDGLSFLLSNNKTIAETVFAYLMSELVKKERDTFSFVTTIVEPQFCTLCRNELKYQRSTCRHCPGCDDYFHEKCLSEENSMYCCSDCYSNSFVRCEASGTLYPFQRLKRCLLCRSKFVCQKEIELRGVTMFCCRECRGKYQSAVSNFYMEKCYSVAAQKMSEMYHAFPEIKDNPNFFLAMLFVVREDIKKGSS
ncbi:hypothetical protein EIN_406080 [Entamoeba invadens IP1]|uniref:Phorbol-ester/DAG-type domain-containing protein n=1 Tax=Entamoeba invadens IP1 TaxID=370355 RepID=A0A0A1UCY3_ENTIV|nr:hypothetical protein EIN_406080 [Entamoeba invadens IP1]ELP90154.1 hypothetical protein EIN_406080 [Entamoeba invadens IP1]|eukprot:XP_004256925.1 hypothetical protein EIN_406080 [Entamoeba invadens IP1]